MWVIYNAQTGEELERVETSIERNTLISAFNDNEYGDQFEYRWEE
jgi:hypothetical protein